MEKGEVTALLKHWKEGDRSAGDPLRRAAEDGCQAVPPRSERPNAPADGARQRSLRSNDRGRGHGCGQQVAFPGTENVGSRLMKTQNEPADRRECRQPLNEDHG